MENMEKRSFATEVRLSGDEAKPSINGSFALFNTRAEIYPGRFEEIKPGAFDGVLKSDDVRALFNHNVDNILGRKSAGTLRMVSDTIGAHYEIDPPDTQAGKDTVISIKRGDVTGSSFSFRVEDDGEEFNSIEGGVLRTINKVAEIGDVGPVTYPAYENTTVSARSKDKFESFAQAEDVEQQEALDAEAIEIESEARKRKLELAKRG